MKQFSADRIAADQASAEATAKVRRVRAVGAARAATYKERQAALGRRQRPMWLTDAEFATLKEILQRIRERVAASS